MGATDNARSGWAKAMGIVILCATLWLPTTQAKAAADYFVHSLPGAPAEPALKMYAGHIEIKPEQHGNMFFWLFKNRHIADRQRTVIWLNGGPGCSSMDGALMEVGPYRVNEDGTLRLQEGSWDEFANIVFVDEPLGTGFSYVDTNAYLHELTEAAADMVTFLEKFFKIFPDLAHDDIYIAGESYAGQTIPYVAQAILDRNAPYNAQDSWNLTGLLIGNGWISGQDQYTSYVPMAYEGGVLQPGSAADEVILRQQEACTHELQNIDHDFVDNQVCESILQEILRNTIIGDKQCVNMYDLRLRDRYPSCGMAWPSDLTQMTPYLRRPDVLKALNVNPDKNTGWEECNGQVGHQFNAHNSPPSVKLLPNLLSHMPIILFSGDKDLICNHIGTENLINNLNWNGAVGMEESPGVTAARRDWTFEGEPAGQYQTARNLTYIRFYNASHMVPFDYPRRTRDMLDRFMGVDIASIGGVPADSRIDGEKGMEVSVGGHPNSTVAEQEEADKLRTATWMAYRRSGEVALVVVLIIVSAWGYFIYRDRRRRQGYTGVLGLEPYDGPARARDSMVGGLGLDLRSKRERDVEAARDFDEAELDDLASPPPGHVNGLDGRDHFGLDDEEEEDEGLGRHGRSNGRVA